MTHPARRKDSQWTGTWKRWSMSYGSQDTASTAEQHGTPLVVVDHKVLRETTSNSERCCRACRPTMRSRPTRPAIVQTFYDAGASFDVASMAEFLIVHEKIEHLPPEQRQAFIWDRIIYANPIKAIETLQRLDPYKPLVTYDNYEEVIKIARHAPHSALCCGCSFPTPDRWWSSQASLRHGPASRGPDLLRPQ